MPTYADLINLARTSAANSTGYSQAERTHPTKYDCSSFVGRHLNQVGIKINPYLTTADMNPDKKNAMTGAGFIWHEGMDGVEPGDVLWREGHTEFSSGNGNTIGAHSTKSGVSERKNKLAYRGYWRYTGDRGTPTIPTETQGNPQE